MGILKERLNEALESKKNDISSFIWKGEKIKIDGRLVQSEKRLIDCTLDELKRNYDYCDQMINNPSVKKPGRVKLISILESQIDKCNCELFLRWLYSENNKDKFTFSCEIKRVIDNNDEIRDKLHLIPISALVHGLPNEFSNITIKTVLDGTFDKLGVFDRKHLTNKFIFKQGIWLTSDEIKELTILDENGKTRDRLEVIRENLSIKTAVPLKITPMGLSYTAFRGMCKLKNKKYSELTTIQLQTLRNKILFELIGECHYQIKQWELRKSQIVMVAESKDWVL